MRISLPPIPEAARKNLENIIAGYSPRRVILFGSFARGDAHEGSDLDLIIIKDTEERFADRIEHVLEFSDGEMAIQPLVYTPEEVERMLQQGNSFVEKALQEGIVVYEQGKIPLDPFRKGGFQWRVMISPQGEERFEKGGHPFCAHPQNGEPCLVVHSRVE